MELTTNIAYGIAGVTPYFNSTTTNNEYGIMWNPKTQINLKLSNEQTKTEEAVKLTTEINF